MLIHHSTSTVSFKSPRSFSNGFACINMCRPLHPTSLLFQSASPSPLSSFSTTFTATSVRPTSSLYCDLAIMPATDHSPLDSRCRHSAANHRPFIPLSSPPASPTHSSLPRSIHHHQLHTHDPHHPQPGERREVKRKLLDLTQHKLSSIDCDHALRNKVLLQSALRSALLRSESIVRDRSSRSNDCVDRFATTATSSSSSTSAATINHQYCSPRKRSLSSLSTSLASYTADDTMGDIVQMQDGRRSPSSSPPPVCSKRVKLLRSRVTCADEPMEMSATEDEFTLSSLASYFLQLNTQPQ